MVSLIESAEKKNRLPIQIIWCTIAISVIPFFLHLAGFDFGSRKIPFVLSSALEMTAHEVTESMFVSLSGSFTHTLLEWSAFVSAIFVAILAFVHFSIKRDVTTPVIGMALFFAGSMYALHTLAADRLIEAVADNRDLIPFTWAISRLFNALIMIVGVGIFLIKGDRNLKGDLRFVLTASGLFGLAAYGIIHLSAVSTNLPQTTFPESIVTRPYDILPLILFIFAGIFVYPRFHRKHPSLFSHAVLVSAIPDVAVQIYMAFGSTALFDSFFNIAHFIKILAYVIPFAGLILDYLQTYRGLETENVNRLQAEEEMRSSRMLLQEAFDAIPLWVFVKDLDGRYLVVNRQFANDLGVTVDALLGMTTRQSPLGNDEDKRRFLKNDELVLARGERIEWPETYLSLPDGEVRPFHVVKAPFQNSKGETVGVIGAMQDVTVRVEAEKELRESEGALLRLKQTQTLSELQASQSSRIEAYRDFIHTVGNLITPVRVKAANMIHDHRNQEYLDQLQSRARLLMEKQQTGDLERYLSEEGKEDLPRFIRGLDILKEIARQSERDFKACDTALNKVIETTVAQSRLQKELAVSMDVDLMMVIKAVLSLMEDNWKQKGIAWEFSVRGDDTIPPGEVILKVEKVRLFNMVHNCLKNAGEAFTGVDRNDKKIHIELRVSEQDVRLDVSDNGQGLSTEELALVGQIGFSTKHFTATSEGGSGLGIHNCQIFMARIGGRFELTSKGPLQGARAIMTFPIG